MKMRKAGRHLASRFLYVPFSKPAQRVKSLASSTVRIFITVPPDIT